MSYVSNVFKCEPTVAMALLDLQRQIDELKAGGGGTIDIDPTVTPDSNNPVSSKGIYDYVEPIASTAEAAQTAAADATTTAESAKSTAESAYELAADAAGKAADKMPKYTYSTLLLRNIIKSGAGTSDDLKGVINDQTGEFWVWGQLLDNYGGSSIYYGDWYFVPPIVKVTVQDASHQNPFVLEFQAILGGCVIYFNNDIVATGEILPVNTNSEIKVSVPLFESVNSSGYYMLLYGIAPHQCPVIDTRF